MSNLDQSLTLSLIDKYTAPAKRIASVGDDLTSKLSAGQKAINKLGQQNKSISRLKSLERTLGSTAAEMDKARAETARLGRELAATEKPTKRLQNQFEAARKKSDRLKNEHGQQRESLRRLRGELQGAGVDTRRLGDAQAGIKSKIDATTSSMRKLAEVSARVDAAQQRFDKSLQRQANATIAAAGVHRVGSAIMSGLTNPLQQMRGVEQAKGELQSVGIENTAAVIEKGRQMSRQLAGIDTAAFTRAAYDIKSGISSLTDRGVADMTASAALTAKATKADVGQMTSLFATAYGTYKKQLYEGLSDIEFGQRFSASLSASVQQFKTTGAGMQSAIQSMGSGLSESGISLAEQLAGLGMLQTNMDAGTAGTTLKAVERSAAQAQERFAKMGFGIKTLDESGNMRSLPALLEQMQATFGDSYSTQIGSIIQEAFGSDEATVYFKALWGQQDKFRENTKLLEQAQRQGTAFTTAMAKQMDDNWDARLTIVGQRWNTIMEDLGYKLVPVLERVVPAVEWVVGAIGNFIDKNPSLTTGLLGVAGVVGGLALVAAPVIVSVAALGTTLSWLGVQAARANAAAAMGGMGGGKGRGRWFKGMGGKLGMAGALATGALSIGSTLMDDSQSGTDKAASITKDVGTIGGGLVGAAKGAALGAALGSVVPVLGTAVGGVLGSIVGGIGGSLAGGWLGDKLGGGIKSVFGEDDVAGQVAAAADSPAAQVQRAVAASQDVGVRAPTPVHHEDKRQYNLNAYQQPGEDTEAFARRVMEMLRNQDAASARGALYDPVY